MWDIKQKVTYKPTEIKKTNKNSQSQTIVGLSENRELNGGKE